MKGDRSHQGGEVGHEMEISEKLLEMEAFAASFCASLDDARVKATEAAQLRVKLSEMKSKLRESEDVFVKLLREKTRKDARQVEMKEQISATRHRIDNLRKTVEVQKRRRDDYRGAVSDMSNCYSNDEHEYRKKKDIEEATCWYNKVLGFQIESGRGVKFSFNNVDARAPNVEYTFTVRYDDNTYTLLACDPQLDGTKEMVSELNRTNGLYEFVRKMRQKFQQAALLGCAPEHSLHQKTITVTESAPELSISTAASDDTESVQGKNQQHLKKGWELE